MRKRWCANTRPIRASAAITDQVVAVVALGPFDWHHRFSCRNHRAPAHAKKMMDERFDVMHGVRLGWRRGKRMLRIARASWHVVNALLDDAKALADLLYVHDGAVIAIARAASRYVKFELIVAGVRLLLSEVPLESAGTQVRACHAPFNGFLNCAASNALRSLFEQIVAHNDAIVLIEPGWQI